jgi:hypothetical protein
MFKKWLSAHKDVKKWLSSIQRCVNNDYHPYKHVKKVAIIPYKDVKKVVIIHRKDVKKKW